MRRLLVIAGVVAAFAVTGCQTTEPDTDTDPKLSRALCSDLDDGLTPMNIKPADMSAEDFAAHLYVATEDTCPKHRDDPAVQTLLKNWGYID